MALSNCGIVYSGALTEVERRELLATGLTRQLERVGGLGGALWTWRGVDGGYIATEGRPVDHAALRVRLRSGPAS